MVFCFAQSENLPPVYQCHTYLLTYYPVGYPGDELPDNGSPRSRCGADERVASHLLSRDLMTSPRAFSPALSSLTSSGRRPTQTDGGAAGRQTGADSGRTNDCDVSDDDAQADVDRRRWDAPTARYAIFFHHPYTVLGNKMTSLFWLAYSSIFFTTFSESISDTICQYHSKFYHLYFRCSEVAQLWI